MLHLINNAEINAHKNEREFLQFALISYNKGGFKCWNKGI